MARRQVIVPGGFSGVGLGPVFVNETQRRQAILPNAVFLNETTGQDFSDSVSESITLSDSSDALLIVNSASTSESINLSDSPSTQTDFGPNQAESLTFSDAGDATASVATTVSESMTLSDANVGTAIMFVDISEAKNHVDTEDATVTVTGSTFEIVSQAGLELWSRVANPRVTVTHVGLELWSATFGAGTTFEIVTQAGIELWVSVRHVNVGPPIDFTATTVCDIFDTYPMYPVPEFNNDYETAVRLLMAQNDAQQDRSSDGLFTRLRKTTLNYVNLVYAEKEILARFFRDHGFDQEFFYQAFGDPEPTLWVISEFDVTPITKGIFDVDVALQEVPFIQHCRPVLVS